MNKLVLFFFFFFGSHYLYAGEINVNGKSVNYSGQHTAHWDKQSWNRSVTDNLYRKFQTEAMKARYEKYLSNEAIKATAEATVSRQSVLSGAFGLVKKGAQLAVSSRGNLYLGGALLAYEAYQAVKGDLESQGYHYDEAKEEFYKDWAARNCIWERDDQDKAVDVDCYGVDSSVIRNKYSDDPKKQDEIRYLMEAQMERLARPYWKAKQKRLAESDSVLDWNKYIFDKCYFNWNGGDCSVKRGDDGRSVIHFSLKMNQRELLTPQKFLEIATPKIDSNPTPFVEGTGRPGYSEGVQVSPGTVVTLGPVTGSDGRPIQIQITFGQDSNGKTTATVNTTPRPDLTPGSPAAPKTNPTPTQGSGNPGAGGKPGEEEKPKDGGLLCEVFPNILACDKQPEAGEEPDLTLPEEVINVEFEKSSALQESAECPAPVTFNVTVLGASKTFAFSFEHACEIASRLRYMLVALAWVVAAFFCIRAVSREV